MYRLTRKQKHVLLSSGWSKDNVDTALYESFDAAWEHIGDLILSYRRKQNFQLVQRWTEVQPEVAEVFRKEVLLDGNPFRD